MLNSLSWPLTPILEHLLKYRAPIIYALNHVLGVLYSGCLAEDITVLFLLPLPIQLNSLVCNGTQVIISLLANVLTTLSDHVFVVAFGLFSQEVVNCLLESRWLFCLNAYSISFRIRITYLWFPWASSVCMRAPGVWASLTTTRTETVAEIKRRKLLPRVLHNVFLVCMVNKVSHSLHYFQLHFFFFDPELSKFHHIQYQLIVTNHRPCYHLTRSFIPLRALRCTHTVDLCMLVSRCEVLVDIFHVISLNLAPLSFQPVVVFFILWHLKLVLKLIEYCRTTSCLPRHLFQYFFILII